MSIITSGNFPKALRPGLKEIFNTEQKDKRQYHLDIFTKVDSDKQYEERMGMVGMGVAVVKPEGSPVQYGDMQQGFIRRTNNVALLLVCKYLWKLLKIVYTMLSSIKPVNYRAQCT